MGSCLATIPQKQICLDWNGNSRILSCSLQSFLHSLHRILLEATSHFTKEPRVSLHHGTIPLELKSSGIDVFSEVIHGTRNDLYVGLSAAILTMILGITNRGTRWLLQRDHFRHSARNYANILCNSNIAPHSLVRSNLPATGFQGFWA